MSGTDRAEEIETDEALARALVAAQFPRWSSLPVSRVRAASTDNDIYRLGEDLAARLPRRAGAVAPIDKEHEWLPRLASRLSVAVPEPVARGRPGLGYPFPWGIVRWVDGETPPVPVASALLAHEVATFIAALWKFDGSSGPSPGAENFWRGAPLSAFDAVMRRRFEWLSDIHDIGEIIGAWEEGLAAPPWTTDPVWIHGDLKGANLLLKDGRLTGVLDWSAAGVGDPAVDIAVAWNLFDAPTRGVFREAIAADGSLWARGRAWALIEGVFALSYYRGRIEALASEGRRIIDEVLADRARLRF